MSGQKANTGFGMESPRPRCETGTRVWNIDFIKVPPGDMMSVVGKSTCSEFKTGLCISYHGGNPVRYIKQRGYFMKDAQISDYFDTQYMTVLRIEQILHNFEDRKFAYFFTSNRSIFA